MRRTSITQPCVFCQLVVVSDDMTLGVCGSMIIHEIRNCKSCVHHVRHFLIVVGQGKFFPRQILLRCIIVIYGVLKVLNCWDIIFLEDRCFIPSRSHTGIRLDLLILLLLLLLLLFDDDSLRPGLLFDQ
jgi:hypothetical protein